VRRRNFRLRGILALLVLATTLPLGLFAGLLIWMSWQQQRAVVDRQNVDTARAMLIAVDKELESTTDALNVLASVDELHRRDLRAFNRLARRLVPREPGWDAVLLLDSAGRLLMSTAARSAQPVALPSADWARTVSASLRPIVSDLLEDPVGGHFVVVAVPVITEGKLQFILAAQLRSSALSEVLRRQNVPPNGVVTLIDRAARIVARTRNEEQYVGKPPSAGFRDAAARMNEGSWRGTLLEGTPSYSALSRSTLTGWALGIGLPAEEIDGPIRRSIWALAAVGIGILILGVTFALVFGHLIVRALGSASLAVRALARSEALPDRHSRIVEIEELSAGLRDAASILSKRLYERDQAEAERGRALADREQALHAEQAARREAEAANRSKDEFVATISHELRTPLNAIFGWVRLLRGGSLDGEAQVRALDVIERNTRAQAQLIDDLLDMSRVVTGNLRLDMREVELGAVLDAAVESVRPAAAAKKLELVVSTAQPGSVVRGDPDRLQQIAWNLLTNSIKFTPEGGRIEVQISVEGSAALLCVSDSGAGIDPDFLPHVFERFRQGASSESRAYGGLGLGLALVRHLVELHGGTVIAESDGVNRGARFAVRIPLIGAPIVTPAGMQRVYGEAGGQPHESALDRLRILAVDDDPDARELLRTALTQAGAQVTTAASMREALDLLASHEFDVLLSDIAMPNGTGYDLLRAVRSNARTASLPAVALTAYSQTEHRERVLSAGFNFHIGKPFELAALVRILVMAAGREARNERTGSG